MQGFVSNWNMCMYICIYSSLEWLLNLRMCKQSCECMYLEVYIHFNIHYHLKAQNNKNCTYKLWKVISKINFNYFINFSHADLRKLFLTTWYIFWLYIPLQYDKRDSVGQHDSCSEDGQIHIRLFQCWVFRIRLLLE